MRIEDTDIERSKDQYTKNICEGLQWLGINWDEPPTIQSERINERVIKIGEVINGNQLEFEGGLNIE